MGAASATPLFPEEDGRMEVEGREERKAGRKEGSGERQALAGEAGTTKPKVLLARSLARVACLREVARHGEVKALWLDMVP